LILKGWCKEKKISFCRPLLAVRGTVGEAYATLGTHILQIATADSQNQIAKMQSFPPSPKTINYD